MYDGILLNSTNGNTTFTLNGFLKLSSLTQNNTSYKTSNNINQIIATKLDSILNNNIEKEQCFVFKALVIGEENLVDETIHFFKEGT